MIQWEGVMIHHSLTKDSGTVSWPAIRRYHTQTKGWMDIGYHFGVESVNDSPEILVGRPLFLHGAHCREGGANRRFIGICFVGNYDIEGGEDLQKLMYKTARYLLVPLCMYVLPTYANRASFDQHFLMHRDYAPYKSCPGTEFPIEDLRDMVWKMVQAERR